MVSLPLFGHEGNSVTGGPRVLITVMVFVAVAIVVVGWLFCFRLIGRKTEEPSF